MKKLILLFVLVPFLIFSQEIFQKEISFSKTVTIAEMIQTDDGFMACGSISNTTLDSTWALLIKFDASMEIHWSKSYTMQAKDDFRTIRAWSDGNFLVGGTSRKEFTLTEGATLFKVDPEGNVIWHHLYSASYDDATFGIVDVNSSNIDLVVRHGVSGSPAKILTIQDNGVLINANELKTVNSPSGIVPDCFVADGNAYYLGGAAFNANTSKYMFYIVKVSNGSVSWYKEYDFGRAAAYCYGITILSNGDIAVSGSVSDDENTSISHTAVMRVSAGNGSVIWAKEIQQTENFNLVGYELTAVDDGGMVVVGQANTLMGFQAFASRLDADGNIIWAKEYGEGPWEILGSVSNVSGNRLMMLGKMAYDEGPYIIKTDQEGVTACLFTDLEFVADNLGTSEYSPQTLIEPTDIEPTQLPLVLTNVMLDEEVVCTGLVNTNELVNNDRFLIYPNPTKDYIYLDSKEIKSSDLSIRLIDVNGREIFQDKLEKSRWVDLTTINPGIYFINFIDSQGKVINSEKLIIQ